MVGGSAGRVKAALVLCVLAGCLWRSYGRVAATHAEVLVALARKGVDLVVGGRFTAETMPELTYPLERAQAFVRTAQARSDDAPPPSLAALETLVARYRDLLDTLDRVRRDATGEPARRELAEALAAVEQAAAAVYEALLAEGWG